MLRSRIRLRLRGDGAAVNKGVSIRLSTTSSSHFSLPLSPPLSSILTLLPFIEQTYGPVLPRGTVVISGIAGKRFGGMLLRAFFPIGYFVRGYSTEKENLDEYLRTARSLRGTEGTIPKRVTNSAAG